MNSKIKTIVGMIVLALFIVSIIPLALAEEGRDNGNDRKMLNDDGNKSTVKEQRDAMKARLEASKENIEQVREQMKQAKEKYQEAREQYREQKEDLKELRDRVKKCKETDDSGECVTVRQSVNKGAKNHLLRTSDLIEKSLERLQERVSSSSVLTAEEKQSALDAINKLEEEVMAEKERVTALAENASAEELRAAVKDLKKTWQDVSKAQKRIIALLTSSKLDHLVEKHEDYVTGMQKRIDALREKGVDVTRLDAIFVQFKAAVATLQEDHAQARQFWLSADANKGSLDNWHGAQEQVREDLRETKRLLREFVKATAELTKSEKEDQSEENESSDDEDASANATLGE